MQKTSLLYWTIAVMQLTHQLNENFPQFFIPQLNTNLSLEELFLFNLPTVAHSPVHVNMKGRQTFQP